MLPVGFEVVNAEVTSEVLRDPKVLDQAFQEHAGMLELQLRAY